MTQSKKYSPQNSQSRSTKDEPISSQWPSDEQKQLNHILQYLQQTQKTQYKRKILPNFLILKCHHSSSNQLIQCLYAMISQKTNEFSISKQLVDLLKQFNKQRKYLVSQEQTKGYLQLFSSNKSGEEIIKAYTKDNFVHRITNNLFRVGKPASLIYLIQPFVKKLFTAIRQKYKKQRLKNFTCYRGAEISEQQLKSIKDNVGSIVQNLGFLSASKNENISYGFVKNVLILIQVKQSREEDFGYASIQDQSMHKQQDQILFNPLNNFKIISVTPQELQVREQFQIFDIIKLEYCYTENKQEHFLAHQRNMQKNYKYFGKLLTGVQQQHSYQYWKKFKELAKKLEEGNIEVVIAEEQLGKIQYRKRDFPKALKHFKNALNMLQKNKNKNQIRKKEKIREATILSHIATIQFQEKKYEQSLKNYNLCSEIEKNLKIDDQYGISLHNIGNVYAMMGDFDEAMKKYKQSLKYKKWETVSWAKTIYSIGKLYHEKKNNKKALKYYKQAIKVKQNFYGKNSKQYKMVEANINELRQNRND